MASAKSLSLASELRDALARRTTLTVSGIGFDTDGGAWLRVGTAGAGNQTAVIKCKEVAPVGSDIVGNAARGYAQHVMQVVLETSTVANVALLTEANKIAIMGEVFRRGTRVELYLSANTNATGLEDITGTPAATWEPDLQYRLMDAQ
jgi:hypothetical protein